jgi:predicted amidohydrolase
MATVRVVLANARVPLNRQESLEIVLETMKKASHGAAALICFPECFLPGYRIGTTVLPDNTAMPDQEWLKEAWSIIDALAAELSLCVILGTERLDKDRPMITARVTNADGTLAGFQDKVQLDPSEDSIYVPGFGRRLFHCGELTFGVVICHEGWRYPETVRWAARNGAHVVFHPHFDVVDNDQYIPSQFADPANTFHEKAALCRAAENTCYFATVNCAIRGSSTTSALVDPQGVLVAHQPYGKEGILFGEIDTEKATGLLAKRFKPESVYD